MEESKGTQMTNVTNSAARDERVAVVFLAEASFDEWREDKGEHTGGIPRRMLRMVGPQATKPGAKDARPFLANEEKPLTDTYNTPSMALLENPADYYYDGSSDKLVHINASPSVDLAYDANGNITAETNRTYVYDLSNQLVSVSGIAQYTYNGAGQRIKKVTGSTTRIFHYDTSGHLIAETDGSGATVAEYVYIGDQLLAMIKPTQFNVLLSQRSPGNPARAHR